MMKHYLKNIVLILIMTCTHRLAFSQAILYSNISLDKRGVNPAAYGQQKAIMFGVAGRYQWIQKKQMPKTISFMSDIPLSNIGLFKENNKNISRSALGLSVLNTSLGVRRFSEVNFSYAYHLPLTFAKEEMDFERQTPHIIDNITLSMGLSYSILMNQADYASLFYDLEGGIDTYALSHDQLTKASNLGFGIILKNHLFEVGYSMPYLFSQDNVGIKKLGVFSLAFDFKISQQFKLNTYMRVLDSQVNFDRSRFGVMAEYQDKITLGVGKFSKSSIEVLTAWKVSKSLELHYLFNLIDNQDLASKNFSSHEFALYYKLNKK